MPGDNKAINRGILIKDYLPVYFFVIIAILSTVIIGYLKVDSFRSWRYTSDLFTYDTAIQETARGFFGLEFTYCNVFGDHAYLFLLLLTPLKLFLKSRMIYVLLLLGPLAYCISNIVFFFATRRITGTINAFFLSTIFLFGYSKTYHGLYESFFGMHPDIFSGFVAVAMAAMLIWKENDDANNKNSRFQTIGAVFFLFLFLIIKEEMAILAFIFFSIAFIFKRTTFHRNLAILSIVTCVFDFIFIRLSQTPFNRTDNALISKLIHQIKSNVFIFTNLKGNTNLQFTYISIILCSILFILAVRFSKQINLYAASLFIIGLIKLFFGLATLDFNITRWHNYPGFIMIFAALLFQFLFVKKIQSKYSFALLLIFVTASVFCYFKYEIPYVRQQLSIDSNQKYTVSIFKGELSKIMKQIDPMQVVSIPTYTAEGLLRYRYAFYPNGVSNSPLGIADYIIYPINKAAEFVGKNNIQLPLAKIPNSFNTIMQTNDFILLKRVSLSKKEISSRASFYGYEVK